MPRYLTQESLGKFKKELKLLETTGRRKIAERIKHTASFGDLKENAAYDEAKEAQGFLEAKIRELRLIVSQAQVVERGAKDKVGVGSVVELGLEKEKLTFQLVEPEEADPVKGKISHLSPLGQAISGKAKGAKVKVKTPESIQEYTVLKIR